MTHDPESVWIAAILAAGSSTRFGKANKLLQPVRGEPLVHRVAEAFASAGARPLVVLGHEATAIRASLADLPVVFCENAEHQTGLGSSIRTAAQWVIEHEPHAILSLSPSDLPFLDTTLLTKIHESFRHLVPPVILRPFYADIPGHPVFFSSGFFEALTRLDGRRGARDLIEVNKSFLHAFPLPSPRLLTDIDTPEDLSSLPAT